MVCRNRRRSLESGKDRSGEAEVLHQRKTATVTDRRPIRADYPASHEAMILWAMIALMTRRLSQPAQ